MSNRTENSESESPSIDTNQNAQTTTTNKITVIHSSNSNDNEIQYCYEDEVYRFEKNNRIRFGLVTENYEHGTSDTETENEDMVRKGHIRVCWHPDGNEEVIDQTQIGLADRTLMPGDVVRRMVNGKDAQKGYCRDIRVTADVHVNGTKFVIKDVLSDRLKPLVTMVRDNAVCLGAWVGSTKTINERVVLQTACGGKVEIRPSEICSLHDADCSRFGMFSSNCFYPGQKLCGMLSASDNPKWLTQTQDTRKMNRIKSFTVQSVELEGVWVHWQCRAFGNDSNSDIDLKNLEQKHYVMGSDLKNLKRLNLFESCMLQINDRNSLQITDGDILISKSQWKREISNKFKMIVQQEKIKSLVSADKPVKNNHNIIEEKKLNHMESNHLDVAVCSDKHATLAKIESDGWQTDSEDESYSNSLRTGSSCSSPTPKSSPKRSPLLVKKIKNFRKRKNKNLSAMGLEVKLPKVGDTVITETLVVYSMATVVWQDGVIESGIHSTNLIPIHHLDEHEFFPGDFVLSVNDLGNCSRRTYGVIQKVDHFGRTAIVKWFKTYTTLESPIPTYLSESEVSVYDLKDHSDFQYRPGTIVVRVSGNDDNCTAGQVVDNYPEGRVKVWWVSGIYTMCWPQDIFEVGQYDPDHNIWITGESDDDSWETESEISEIGSPQQSNVTQLVPITENLAQIKPKLLDDLERTRLGMKRLEQMLFIYPNSENQEIMTKLLEVYKNCRFIDRLMNTSYFHENHFSGLIERVRKVRSNYTTARKQEHLNRLFNDIQPISPNSGHLITSSSSLLPSKEPCNLTSIMLKTPSSYKGPLIRKKSFNMVTVPIPGSTPNKTDSNVPIWDNSDCDHDNSELALTTSDIKSSDKSNLIEDDWLKTNRINTNVEQYSPISNDSGNATHTNNIETKLIVDFGDVASGGSSSELNGRDVLATPPSTQTTTGYGHEDDLPENLCARFFAVLRTQFMKAFNEINEKCDLLLDDESIRIDSSKGIDDKQSDCDLNTTPNLNKCKMNVEPIQSTIESVDLCMNEISTSPIDSFVTMEMAPQSHKFYNTTVQPINTKKYYLSVNREYSLLKTGLPSGVLVRSFDDRMDLLSVLIEGPKHTPYEDGIFLFDFQLGMDYPNSPPLCHYISYCSDRLNPNLYEDGKVCVSLLGTWVGRGSEVWGPKSSLLQIIVSIQGLILVSEPYFNEAGYERQKGTQQGLENSKMYNEMVILKLIQSITKMIASPPDIFAKSIIEHFLECGQKMITRIRYWMELSVGDIKHINDDGQTDIKNKMELPQFSLIPASRGFCLTLGNLLERFNQQLAVIKLEKIDQKH